MKQILKAMSMTQELRDMLPQAKVEITYEGLDLEDLKEIAARFDMKVYMPIGNTPYYTARYECLSTGIQIRLQSVKYNISNIYKKAQ